MKKKLFLLLLLGISYYFYSKKATDSLIIISALILFVIIFHFNENIENMGNLTNEAIQNLSSMYNSGTVKATNLELTGDLKVGGKTVLSSSSGDLTISGKTTLSGDLNIIDGKKINLSGDLNINGKTTMNSNLFLNQNLKMQEKKILSLGNIGMTYANMPNRRDSGHFSMFRGSDGQNILTQQVDISGSWGLTNPHGKFWGNPWGDPGSKVYSGKAFDDLQITKNTDLFP